ncbi:MAG: cyclic nucleotide-binding domain-containing protein, partial [Solirubrobacteraceae bacterium]
MDTFLARQPPFDQVEPNVLREVAATAIEQPYDAGRRVLVEDGPPAAGLWVILSGSMDIVHEGEVIQVLEPGECFGHPSLLTGMAPAFTIRARERAVCVKLSEADGRRVLGTEAGAAYVARSMRKRLTRAGHTVHGLLDVGTTPISVIMRPVEFCDPDATVREAARRLGQDGVRALLLDLGSGESGI